MSGRKKLTIFDVVELITGEESDIGDENDEDGDGEEEISTNMNDDHNEYQDEAPTEVSCSGDDQNHEDEDAIDLCASVSKKKSYTWLKKEHDVPHPRFVINSDSSDLSNASLDSACDYFRRFITDEMLDLVVSESNIYYFQQKGHLLNLNTTEVCSVLGIYLLMGIVQMPSVRDYFVKTTGYDAVSSVMSRNRLELILRYLHFANNETVDEKVKETNKAWKIAPWLVLLRAQCLLTEPQENNAIDEMLIPFKGKFSRIRQYIRGKPHPWGFKVWARAGEDGILYDFELYTGAAPGREKSTLGVGGDVILRLSETLPQHQNFKVFADNFFSGIPMIIALKSKGIHYTGTIRKGRLPGCQLREDKDLEKEGRGACDYRVERDTDICSVKWNDTKCVTLVSTYLGVSPMAEIQRWDKKKKGFVKVQRPNIVSEYNSKMGGVDLLDFLCGKYRYKLRSKRWYMHIFWYSVELAVVNAWLVYRRDFKKSGLESKNMMTLKQFQSDVAHCLIKQEKSRKRGRPSSTDVEISPSFPRKVRKEPPTNLRKDGFQHLPTFTTRGKCAFCKTGFCETSCRKCGVRLCIKKSNNCFADFH